MSDRTDWQLISEYLNSGDEAAFGSLAERHAPMVYRVCLRIIGERSAAEDAAQATFVVLLRKAGSLRRGGDLSSWLHGVARNVALQARRSRYRRAQVEEAVAMSKEDVVRPADTNEGRELLFRLDGEVARLPAHQRQAVILRYLEGRSEVEAARIAGCPQGTLSKRASLGMARLRERLGRRGAVLGIAALAGLLSSEAEAAVPSTLLPSVLAVPKLAAAGAAAGAGGGAICALAEGVLKMMFWAKVKTIGALLAGALAIVIAAAVAGKSQSGNGLKPAAESQDSVESALNKRVAVKLINDNLREACDTLAWKTGMAFDFPESQGSAFLVSSSRVNGQKGWASTREVLKEICRAGGLEMERHALPTGRVAVIFWKKAGPAEEKRLLAAATSADAATRAGVASELAGYGNEKLLGAFVRLLADSDEQVRKASRSAAVNEFADTEHSGWGLFGDRPCLMLRLRVSQVTRVSVAKKLAEEFGRTREPDLLTLAGLLGDVVLPLAVIREKNSDPDLLTGAIGALAFAGDPRQAAHLLPLLEDNRPAHDRSPVAMNAAHALGWLRDRQAVERLIRMVKEAEDGIAAGYVAHALASIGDERAVPVLEEALQGKCRNTKELPRAAAAALGLMNCPAARDALVAAAGRDHEITVDGSLLAALAKFESRNAKKAIIRRLKTGDLSVRSRRAYYVSRVRCRDERVVNEIVGLYDEARREIEAKRKLLDPGKRELTDNASLAYLAKALLGIRTDAAIEALAVNLKTDDVEILSAVTSALGDHPDPRMLKPLLAAARLRTEASLRAYSEWAAAGKDHSDEEAILAKYRRAQTLAGHLQMMLRGFKGDHRLREFKQWEESFRRRLEREQRAKRQEPEPGGVKPETF